jgi:hypothetical protein
MPCGWGWTALLGQAADLSSPAQQSTEGALSQNPEFFQVYAYTAPIRLHLRPMKPGAKALPISLIKKKFTRKSPRNERDYSPGIKFPKSLAPAKTQSRASFLILSNKTKDGDSLLWNTLAFRSCQISQTVSKVRVANPFRCKLGPSAKDAHHSSTLRSPHCLGWIP